MVYCVCTIARRCHQVQMSESSQHNIHRSTAMICIVMMAFISGEYQEPIPVCRMGSEYTVKIPTIPLYSGWDFQTMGYLW
jgi:hypothetical protein